MTKSASRAGLYPGWVVKFLVDNSLGKLYLEMFPTQYQRKI